MSILACISLVIVDSLDIVDNLPLTDESTITRGDCSQHFWIQMLNEDTEYLNSILKCAPQAENWAKGVLWDGIL